MPYDHVIKTQTPGGGGWDDARTRDTEAVTHDVTEELISPERAESVYGVTVER